MSLVHLSRDRLKRLIREEHRQGFRNRVAALVGPFYARDLKRLALLYGSDKWDVHWYAQHYERHFSRWRRRSVNLLEIGVGGYEDPQRGGASLRMWKRYFPKGRIYGLDIHDKRGLEEARIRIFRGSQDDPEVLQRVIDEIGRVDIVIDDGSHVPRQVIRSFEILFPRMAEGGIYAIEDLHTSYWPEFGGNLDLGAADTTMGRLKRLVDGLNYREFLDETYEPDYFDRNVSSVHFYHNLAVVQKGANTEEGALRP